MAGLGESEIEDAREVFDLFDFWDGRDGEVDAFKLGDLLRCLGHNPTQATVAKHGGTQKMGEKSYKFEEFIPLYKELMNEKDTGTFADFMEAFKTFDREGQGFISGAELRHLLTSLGEKLSDLEVDDILRYIDLTEDLEGNVKYEECIKKVMEGPN
jgi:Ca2+-binding EF-hand superfamily protein